MCTAISYFDEVRYKHVSVEFTFVCSCWRIEKRKICLKLKLAISKSTQLWSCSPSPPEKSPLFKGLVADTALDMCTVDGIELQIIFN